MKLTLTLTFAFLAVVGVLFQSTNVAHADGVGGLVIVVTHEADAEAATDAADGVSLTAIDHRYRLGPTPTGYGSVTTGDHEYVTDVGGLYNRCGNARWNAREDEFKDAPAYEPGEQRVSIVVGKWTDADGTEHTRTAGSFGFFGQNATLCSLGT